ncbi:lasso peptide biosynthesis PqqD family chaperone [Actinomadura fulvescens]|uniref:Coenzyme PQQ synthesis protein D (PqqD) n=1 Tax=Actinomadura fulvescens TaxID=46160 RepID=A0ABN3QFZ6_9ACTN
MAVRLRDGVSVAEVEHGFALLDERSGEYWTLNPTGSVILSTLLDGGTYEQAARHLADQYAIAVETVTGDVRQLVDDLESAGLIDDDGRQGEAR